MPATFASTSAVVLPIKIRWPRAFDGVALVVGAAAPDQGYAVYGWLHVPATHAWNGLLWFVLPITILEVWLCRRAAPIVAAHLAAISRPAWLAAAGRRFAVGDYGAIGTRRHRWYVTIYSTLLGGVLHLVWDGLSHRPGAPGWSMNLLPFLHTPAIEHLAWWHYSETISDLAGAIVTVALFARIGRRRLIRDWDGPAPAAPVRPGLFWTCTGAAVTVYVATWPIANYKYTDEVQGVRLLWMASLGLLAGAAAVSITTRHRTAPRPAVVNTGGAPPAPAVADPAGHPVVDDRDQLRPDHPQAGTGRR